MMTRVRGLTALTLQLTRARFVIRQGEALLYFAGILATTISATLALTVAGGTWMFYDRWRNPTESLAAVLAEDASFGRVLMFYFVLSLIACALVVPAMASLSASAAVLGARGRERRLAALRLVGLSAADVTRMSLIDTIIQASLGSLIGGGIYLVTAPLWRNLELLGMPTVLMQPWWLAAAVLLANLVIAMIATWWGLRQVRISPLGVARRTIKPPLSSARLLVVAVILAASAWVLTRLNLGSHLSSYLVLTAVTLGGIAGYNIGGPWSIQALAKLLYHLPGAASMLAARRIEADARATWRRVGGLGLIALVAGYLAAMPFRMESSGGPNTTSFVDATMWDFTKGGLITLAVSMTLTATAILISQASTIIERSELSVALHQLGTPRSFHPKVQWRENLGPLVLTTAIGYACGSALAYPMVELAKSVGAPQPEGGAYLVLIVTSIGLALAGLALLATQPLHHRILTTMTRRND